MIYRIEVEFKKLKEFDFDKFIMSCSTIEVDEYSLDFCSTEVYDHGDTINILMKDPDNEDNELMRIKEILKSPDNHSIKPYIAWMEIDGRELDEDEINKTLRYKEFSLIQ